MTFDHHPVLLEPVLHHLAPKPGARVLDGTVGGAGHAAALLKAAGPEGFLDGLDQDPMALEAAGRRLEAVAPGRFRLHRTNFADFDAASHGPYDTILLDIGVSSPQLDRAERGFSFTHDGPLDMRMDPDGPTTARDLVMTAPEVELARIFHEYGEERHSRRLARAIVARRGGEPFETTSELAAFVRRQLPKDPSGIHPATRAFQGLRIAVNDELGALERVLPKLVDALRPGGRLGVISFHSLEDRLVKRFFQAEAKGCVCPPKLPVCMCGRTPRIRVLTGKPVMADDAERHCNPRARSAKLRVCERI